MKQSRKHKPHKGRRRFGTKHTVDLWEARLVGEDVSWRRTKPDIEKYRLWKFLPEDPTPFDFEDAWNHGCRNQQREKRGLKPLPLSRGGDGAIVWAFEQLAALFLWQCRNPSRFSNKPLMDYLCLRTSEFSACCKPEEQSVGTNKPRRHLLEDDYRGIGPALLAAITADRPFTGTATDLLELLTSVKCDVEMTVPNHRLKPVSIGEYIVEWLDRNWEKVEATFDATREIDSKGRMVYSIKLGKLIPLEKLREVLSTFPEMALPLFPVVQRALARLFALVYWGDRAASVAAKKALEELLPTGNQHPITPHLPKIIEIFARKRNGIIESNGRIKIAHPRLREVERIKMLSVLYSEDSATILDAIRDQSERAFLAQRISNYLPVSTTQAKRAVTAALSRSSK